MITSHSGINPIEGRTILIAVLDKDDKPVWTTRMIGLLEVDVESDEYETFSAASGSVVSSWSSRTGQVKVTATGHTCDI